MTFTMQSIRRKLNTTYKQTMHVPSILNITINFSIASVFLFFLYTKQDFVSKTVSVCMSNLFSHVHLFIVPTILSIYI